MTSPGWPGKRRRRRTSDRLIGGDFDDADEDDDQMPKKVPLPPRGADRARRAALLAEYARARGVVIAPPIPIEDIVEKHLKLGIEFDDMHQLFGVSAFRFRFRTRHPRCDLFRERRIVIDESLDPEENPSKEGRYRFTLAHEVAGIGGCTVTCLPSDPAQVSLFNEPAPPSVVCRSSQAKEPVEWQADFYASCLLMPRKLVMAAWGEVFPDGKPRVLKSATPFDHAFVEFNRETFVTPVRWRRKPTIRRLTVSRRPSRRNFSSRRSLCASGWRSSDCSIARSRISAFLPVARRPLF